MDELSEDEVVSVVKEHINKRQIRRAIKDKEDILKHLIQGVINNPNAYVIQSLKAKENRQYTPRVKEEK